MSVCRIHWICWWFSFFFLFNIISGVSIFSCYLLDFVYAHNFAGDMPRFLPCLFLPRFLLFIFCLLFRVNLNQLHKLVLLFVYCFVGNFFFCCMHTLGYSSYSFNVCVYTRAFCDLFFFLLFFSF